MEHDSLPGALNTHDDEQSSSNTNSKKASNKYAVPTQSSSPTYHLPTSTATTPLTSPSPVHAPPPSSVVVSIGAFESSHSAGDTQPLLPQNKMDTNNKQKRKGFFPEASVSAPLIDTIMLESFPRPLPPYEYSLVGKHTNELDLTTYIMLNDAPHARVPSALLFDPFEGPFKYYMIRAGYVLLVFIFIWNVFRIYFLMYNIFVITTLEKSIQTYIKWLNLWPFIVFPIMAIGVHTVRHAAQQALHYRQQLNMQNQDTIDQALDLDMSVLSESVDYEHFHSSSEHPVGGEYHPIRYQYCALPEFIAMQQQQHSTLPPGSYAAELQSIKHHVRIHPIIQKEQLKNTVFTKFKKPNWFVRLMNKILKFVSRVWKSPIWMTTQPYTSLSGWYIDPRVFILLVLGFLCALITGLLAQINFQFGNDLDRTNIIEVYLYWLDISGWITAVSWIVILMDRLLCVMSDIVGHLHLCRDIEHARDAYEHVYRAFKLYRKGSQTYINVCAATLSILSLHSLLGSIGNNNGLTVLRFVALSSILLYFLISLLTVNSKMDKFTGDVLKFQVLSAEVYKVMGLLDYLRNNPIVYKVFGVPITANLITGYCLTAAAAIIGSLASTIYEWCKSGFF